MVYSDLSPRMLAHAAAGTPNLKRAAADAMALPFKGLFDICIMVMDALDYLLQEEDVLRCLKEVLRVLEPGGLFIVNIASESACRKHMQALEWAGKVDGREFSLHSRYDAGTRLLRTRFALFPSGEVNGGGALEESHVQHIYSRKAMHQLALGAGFKVLGCFENHTFDPANRDSEVLHFVLRKPH